MFLCLLPTHACVSTSGRAAPCLCHCGLLLSLLQPLLLPLLLLPPPLLLLLPLLRLPLLPPPIHQPSPP